VARPESAAPGGVVPVARPGRRAGSGLAGWAGGPVRPGPAPGQAGRNSGCATGAGGCLLDPP
jgi:hypothetical protein